MSDRRHFLRACLAAGGLVFVPNLPDRYRYRLSGLIEPSDRWGVALIYVPFDQDSPVPVEVPKVFGSEREAIAWASQIPVNGYLAGYMTIHNPQVAGWSESV